TAGERASMQRHPRLANDWLGTIPFLSPALEIPYCHHERWDGNGYPQGLHGEETPLSARIFAVVDIWDALRSNRPYRASWSESRVREYIQSLAGTHLDPSIVPTFLDLIGEEEGTDSDLATAVESN
ncbi:HD-GYP domain-containing protein, partial [Singulisphaera rosea]